MKKFNSASINELCGQVDLYGGQNLSFKYLWPKANLIFTWVVTFQSVPAGALLVERRKWPAAPTLVRDPCPWERCPQHMHGCEGHTCAWGQYYLLLLHPYKIDRKARKTNSISLLVFPPSAWLFQPEHVRLLGSSPLSLPPSNQSLNSTDSTPWLFLRNTPQISSPSFPSNLKECHLLTLAVKQC